MGYEVRKSQPASLHQLMIIIRYEGQETKSQLPPVSSPQQPKAVHVSAPQSQHDLPHPETTETAIPTHENSANRAYEIYVDKNCRQIRSEENGLQAEREQLNRSPATFLPM
jgi:hypothetical protein